MSLEYFALQDVRLAEDEEAAIRLFDERRASTKRPAEVVVRDEGLRLI